MPKTLEEYIAMLPETERAEATKHIKGLIAAANPLIDVDNYDKAIAVIDKTPVLKSAFDARISKIVADHDADFLKDFNEKKLSKLVDDEVLKRNPPKDPRDVELLEIKRQLAERDQRELRALQKELVLKLAIKDNIPAKVAETCIGANDAETLRNYEALKTEVVSWRDKHAEAILKEKIGDVGSPRGGGERKIVNPQDLRTKLAAAQKAAAEALAKGDVNAATIAADNVLILQTEIQGLESAPAGTFHVEEQHE